MSRRRKSNTHLPTHMYLKRRSYWYVSIEGVWSNLGRDYVTAMTRYAQINQPAYQSSKINDLLDRYLTEVAPTKSKNYYRSLLASAKKNQTGIR